LRDLAPYLWAAGVLQLLVASANVFAVRMFGYRETLASVPKHVAQVFVVQNVFIVLTVVGTAGLCFVFPDDLSGGSILGRRLSAFLALFWGIRLLFQLFYYDREVRRRHRVLDALFVLAFAYLTAVFAIAATAG
jgi:alginate O-acetyltransferase complex protein AlgI